MAGGSLLGAGCGRRAAANLLAMLESSSRTLRQEKARLRLAMKGSLAGQDDHQRSLAARRLALEVLNLPLMKSARRVFTCLSFGAEPDTWWLVEALLDSGRQVYVPRMGRGKSRLHVHPFPCRLETLPFGLRQPTAEAAELPPSAIDSSLDVALLLGLAFDRRGFRLGYGRGYFDRFLDGRPFPAVGLAFEAQLLDTVPAEDHDLPVAMVVTEEGVRGGASLPSARGAKKYSALLEGPQQDPAMLDGDDHRSDGGDPEDLPGGEAGDQRR